MKPILVVPAAPEVFWVDWGASETEFFTFFPENGAEWISNPPFVEPNVAGIVVGVDPLRSGYKKTELGEIDGGKSCLGKTISCSAVPVVKSRSLSLVLALFSSKLAVEMSLSSWALKSRFVV